MRKFILAVGLSLAVFVLEAQTNSNEKAAPKMVLINEADLTQDQIDKAARDKKIEQATETANTVAQTAKSAGHEVAVAVDEILGALTKHADAFSKTGAGQFTMGMVFLAIMKDQIPTYVDTVVGYLFGIPFVVFMNCCLMFIYFKTTRPYKRVKEIGADGKKIYEYVDTWYTSIEKRTVGSGKDEKFSTDDRIGFTISFFAFAFFANLLTIWLVIF